MCTAETVRAERDKWNILLVKPRNGKTQQGKGNGEEGRNGGVPKINIGGGDKSGGIGNHVESHDIVEQVATGPAAINIGDFEGTRLRTERIGAGGGVAKRGNLAVGAMTGQHGIGGGLSGIILR